MSKKAYLTRQLKRFSLPQVVIKDPPEFVKRPELEYIKDVGGKVSMPCRAVGTPRPTILWRRVRGHSQITYRHFKL